MKKAENLNKMKKVLIWALTVALVFACLATLTSTITPNNGLGDVSHDKFAAEFQAFMQQYASYDVNEVTFELDSLTKSNDTYMVESGVYEQAVGATISTANNEYSIRNDETTVRFNLNDNCFVVDDEVYVASASAQEINGDLILPIEDISTTLGYELTYSENNLVLTRPFALKRLIVQAKGNVDSCGAIAAVEGYDGLHIFQYATEKATIAAWEHINAQPNVQWCEADGVVTAQEVDEVEAQGLTDSFSYKSWGAKVIGADNYSEYLDVAVGISNLKEVVIAVLDTGIDTDHAWFANRIVPGGQNYTESTSSTAYEYEDVKGHGTHVSGIICDVTLPNVKILPMKVLNDEGKGNTSMAVSAIEEVIKLKKSGLNVCAINMSLSGKDSPVGGGNYLLYKNAITSAYNAGILTVVSSGNDSGDVSTVSPANVDTAITVGSVQRTDSTFSRASSSNYGQYVDLCAPGDSIVSARVNGGTTLMSGTSMAAPHVSAAIAMLMSDTRKNYRYTQIEDVLDANAIDLGTSGWDQEYGTGLINLKYIYATSISGGVTFSNKVQNHTSSFKLTLTCSNSAAKIYYTLDGSEPTPTNGIEYTGPITIERTVEVTARAFTMDGDVITGLSDVSSMSYVFPGYDFDSMFTVLTNGSLSGYRGTLTELIIPEVVNGITVLSIGASVFKSSNIVSITLPETVTSIGSYAFQYCVSLKQIIAPGVTSTATSAFEGCTSLPYVTDEFFPQLETVGLRAFAGCTSLESVSLSKAKTLSTSAFNMDGVAALRLTSVSLPNVTSVGANAFKNCQYLTDINIPNVSSVLGNAFENTGLTSVNWPNVKSVGDSAFKSCTSLTTVTLENATTVGENAFEDCTALSSVYLPLVTSLSSNAFASCTSLTSITQSNLPSVTTIDESAFIGCTALREVSLPLVDTIGNSAFSGCLALTAASIPNAVSIGNNAFENCTSLTQLYLPLIERIGSNVFDASAVQKVVIGKSFVQYTATSIAQSITIYGYLSTAAETYALTYGNQFVAIDEFAIQQHVPSYVRVDQGDECVLSVVASGYELKYEWYLVDTFGSSLLNGQNGSSLTVDTSKVGTYQYYVAITNWDNSVLMSYATVEVCDMPYYTIFASASQGGSISPEGECPVLKNTGITFTFQANVGYRVTQINVDGTPLNNDQLQDAIVNGYTFSNVDNGHDIWVLFEPITFSITVVQSENGDILPYSGATVPYGGQVEITLYPYPGYTVARLIVDGDEIVLADMTKYTFSDVTSNHTFSAVFVAASAQYTVQHWQQSLTNQGTVGPDGNYYSLFDTDTEYGQVGAYTSAVARNEVGFTAQPFSQLIISDSEVTVVNIYYTRNVHQISVQTPNGIERIDGIGTHMFGETVTLTAVLKDGYDFVRWETASLDIANLGNTTLTFVMPDQDVTLTAHASIQQFTITITQGANGQISVNGETIQGGNVTVNYGDSLTLSVKPDTGYAIAKLVVDGHDLTDGDLTSYTFENVTDSHTFTAVFAAANVQYTVKHWQESLTQQNATLVNGKYYTLDSSETKYGATDTDTNATATTYPGFSANTIVQQKILANGTTVVNVYYDRNVHELQLVLMPGITQINGANSSYRFGETVTVTATVEQGFNFSRWEVTLDSVTNLDKNTLTFVMPDEDVTLTAYASIQQFTITITQGANGQISANGQVIKGDSVTVNYGDSLTLTITPNNGYAIAKLVVDGHDLTDGDLTTHTFNSVTSNHTFAAEFVALNGGYTVQHWQQALSEEGATAYNGKYYKLYQTQPLSGQIDELTNATAQQYQGFTNQAIAQQKILPNNQTVVKIYYDRIAYQLELVATKGIQSVIGQDSYLYGETVKISAVLQAGYNFSHWQSDEQVDGNLNNIEVTLTMPAHNVKLTAYATIQTFTITVTQGANGTISPSGKQTVSYGGWIKLTVTPSAGYTIAKLVVDGRDVTDGNLTSYTFDNVTDSHTFTAVFAATSVQYTVKHWQESLTQQNATLVGGKYYTLYSSEIKDGLTGTNTNATATTYPGFSANTIVQQKILSSGTTVVNVYYDRNVHQLQLVTTTGISQINSANSSYRFGETVAVTATVAQGYNFSHWIVTVDGVANLNNATLTFTMPDQDVKLTAYATKQPVVPGEDASYTVIHWQQSLTHENATEHDGKYYTQYETQQQTGKVGAQTNATAQQYDGFSNLAILQQTILSSGETVVNVYYVRNSYTLSLDGTQQGIEQVTGEGSYLYGEKVKVKALVQQGYDFAYWISSATALTGLYSAEMEITMPACDLTLTAYAAIQTFTVRVTQGSHGTISPSGKQTVNYGQDLTLTFTPSKGYHLESVIVNGVSVEFDGLTYTLTAVKQDCTVTAKFAKDVETPAKPQEPTQPEPTKPSNDNGISWYWWLAAPAGMGIAVVVVIVIALKKKK